MGNGELPQEIDDWYASLSSSDKEEMDANLGNGCTVGFDKLNKYYFERNKENPNGNKLKTMNILRSCSNIYTIKNMCGWIKFVILSQMRFGINTNQD